MRLEGRFEIHPRDHSYNKIQGGQNPIQLTHTSRLLSNLLSVIDYQSLNISHPKKPKQQLYHILSVVWRTYLGRKQYPQTRAPNHCPKRANVTAMLCSPSCPCLEDVRESESLPETGRLGRLGRLGYRDRPEDSQSGQLIDSVQCTPCNNRTHMHVYL